MNLKTLTFITKFGLSWTALFCLKSNSNFVQVNFHKYQTTIIKLIKLLQLAEVCLLIGHDSMVGAGSVVTKNVESNSLYVGNPAKKIKDITV